MFSGTYVLLGLLIACFAFWPEESAAVATATSLKIQIYWLNYRMKFQAWRMYRQIVKLSKEAGFPHPGPFKFVPLWEREPLD